MLCRCLQVIMNASLALSFEGVMLVNFRWGSATQQPGIDLLTAGPGGAGAAMVLFRGAILASQFCWSPRVSQ
jgi:hypothetical protein